MGRRDRLEIIAEICDIAKDGTRKTQIMYRCNLSFTQLSDYFRDMLKIELLEKLPNNGNDNEHYKTREKGLDFLQRYHDITEMLRVKDDANPGSMGQYRNGYPNGRINLSDSEK